MLADNQFLIGNCLYAAFFVALFERLSLVVIFLTFTYSNTNLDVSAVRKHLQGYDSPALLFGVKQCVDFPLF